MGVSGMADVVRYRSRPQLRRWFRSGARKEAARLCHVLSITVPEAGHQILFFDPRPKDEQTERHHTGQQKKPVRRDQRSRQHQQRSGVVERMPDPAIGAMKNQCVRSTGDDRIGQIGPERPEGPYQESRRRRRSRQLPSISPRLEGIRTPMPSSVDRSSRRSRSARTPRPAGRNVARMNTPSCRRSSFSRVACDLTLW